MILFLGDSFTWGQGLQYYYLTEHKGWNWEDCQNFVSDNKRFETLEFEADEFRKKNSFSYLVSKELDLPFHTPRIENGGDNQVSYQILQNIQSLISTTNISLIIVQFSSPTRSILNNTEPKFNTIQRQIEHQVERISNLCNECGIEWLGISWQEEIGEILKKEYTKNYIPIQYKNSKYKSFDYTMNPSLKPLFIEETEKIEDGHFNLEGHKVIADSILKKIYSRTDLIEKIKKIKNDTFFRR
jgi:lysophospholipase L1-like esterase